MSVAYRPYQAKLDSEIDEFHAAGARNVLAVLPTGGGKSVIVSNRAARFDSYRQQQVIIAHRQELVSQMAMHVARAGVYHSIMGPKDVIAAAANDQREELGQSFIKPGSLATVAGIDTLNARADHLIDWGRQQSKWTCDEAHHLLELNKWGYGIKLFPNATGLGVTATPKRADGKGLGSHADGVFDAMVLGPNMRDLIAWGNLVPPHFVPPETDFDPNNLTMGDSGDFTPKSMKEASKKSHIVGDVVAQYIKHAFMKRTIVFAIDVEDAIDIANRFSAFGIPAACISAKTKDTVRREYIRQFRAGKLWVLVNVDLFGEGFDVPAVECVIMARPTASLAVYLQQVGRALRPLPGKLFGLIIDLVSNLKRHGPPQQDYPWTLDAREKRKSRPKDPDDMPQRACLNCTRPYPRVMRSCPHCGHVPVPLGGGRSIEQVDGDLMLLDYAALEQLRKSIELETPGNIAIRVGGAAGSMAGKGAANKQMERLAEQAALKDAIAWWAGHERSKGRPDEQSYRRFYIMTGVDVLTAQTLPTADMARIREQVRGWYA